MPDARTDCRGKRKRKILCVEADCNSYAGASREGIGANDSGTD